MLCMTIIIGFNAYDGRVKNFYEVVGGEPEEIPFTLLTDISSTNTTDDSKVVFDFDQIREIVSYFNQFQYQKMKEQHLTLVPSNQTMYLNIFESEIFIDTNKNEIIVDTIIYEVLGGNIDYHWLKEIYDSIEE
ncbi:hypothetical protein [Sutcliffiella halmapala]|uniref:hypothetical protein n=1 Tax=Sutcliffiella halmapala TaxID=79882 RepID=UPI0011164D3B|nr:hypothetical protein [Sutcliffiella halmapala]